MTIQEMIEGKGFSQSSMQALQDVRETHEYAKIWGLSVLQHTRATGTLDEAGTGMYRSYLSDTRWFYGLRLGLWTQEDEDGGHPGIDDAIQPGDVSPISIEKPTHEEDLTRREESPLSASPTEDHALSRQPSQQPSQQPSLHDKSAMKDLDDGQETVAVDADEEVTYEPLPDPVEEGWKESSFVSWLKTKPKIKGYSDLRMKRRSTARVKPPSPPMSQAEDRREPRETTRDPVSGEGSLSTYEENPFKALLDSSMELGDDIASESLAELLAEHEHNLLAIKIYYRLIAKYPEKSGTFAARIEQLKEKEDT